MFNIFAGGSASISKIPYQLKESFVNRNFTFIGKFETILIDSLGFAIKKLVDIGLILIISTGASLRRKA
jgi:hypothetical protein